MYMEAGHAEVEKQTSCHGRDCDRTRTIRWNVIHQRGGRSEKSGLIDSIFGASPKQACALAAVSADVYLGAGPVDFAAAGDLLF